MRRSAGAAQRNGAELKRLFRARIEDSESEYGKTLVELVIRRLKDRGYLNDSQYARIFPLCVGIIRIWTGNGLSPI